jgi:heme/copper-type cytochrome/quinol oxidase subunit 1
MTRRLQHIADPSWQPLLLVAEAGTVVILVGVLCQIAQLYVSIRTREKHLDLPGDPWNGRTLEWSTSSAGLQFCGAADGRNDRRVLADETHGASPDETCL